MRQNRLLCVLAAVAACALPTTATAQEKPPCSSAFNVITREVVGTGGTSSVYVELGAFSCKDRAQALQAAQVAFEAAKRRLERQRTEFKDQCFSMPDMKPVDCETMRPTVKSPWPK